VPNRSTSRSTFPSLFGDFSFLAMDGVPEYGYVGAGRILFLSPCSSLLEKSESCGQGCDFLPLGPPVFLSATLPSQKILDSPFLRALFSVAKSENQISHSDSSVLRNRPTAHAGSFPPLVGRGKTNQNLIEPRGLFLARIGLSGLMIPPSSLFFFDINDCSEIVRRAFSIPGWPFFSLFPTPVPFLFFFPRTPEGSGYFPHSANSSIRSFFIDSFSSVRCFRQKTQKYSLFCFSLVKKGVPTREEV